MIRKRAVSTTRLRVELLETRDLLAADPFVAVNLLPSNPPGSSDLSGDGFPAQVSVIAAASLGFTSGTTALISGSNPNPTIVDPSAAAASAPTTGAPAATTGVGQMTLTTGANTPGIGSFATATAGFASEVGGRS